MENFTRLTLEQSGPSPENNVKISQEMPYFVVSGSDMCDALKTILVGMGFNLNKIHSIFAYYLIEHAYDEYDNNKKRVDQREVNCFSLVNPLLLSSQTIPSDILPILRIKGIYSFFVVKTPFY